MSGERNETGGSAFPASAIGGLSPREGLTIRDWFAGQALTGLVTAAMHRAELDISSTVYAQSAYELADQMLKARAS